MININPSCYSGEDCNNDFTNTTLGFSLVTCSVVATIIALKSSRRTTQFLLYQINKLDCSNACGGPGGRENDKFSQVSFS